jgi:hypothetical protein
MPWWIWLILALFMLAMIVAGIVYAGLHGLHALRNISEIGGRIGERVAAMGSEDQSEDAIEPPLFTQPLSAARNRYVEAHADVIRRKAGKRERHGRVWAKWKHFNN